MLNLKSSELRIKKVEARKINQYSLKGVFIKRWEKQSIIFKELNFHPSAIARVCKGERGEAYKFIWRYADEFISMSSIYEYTLNGVFIKSWVDVYEVVDIKKLDKSKVLRACRDKKSSYANSKWRYSKEINHTKKGKVPKLRSIK